MSIRSLVAAAAATMLVAVLAAPAASAAKAGSPLDRIDHIVVVYQENHSFDNLYGGWEGVDGLATADAAHTVQVNQAGVPYTCLKQNDSHLTSPPLSVTCADSTT